MPLEEPPRVAGWEVGLDGVVPLGVLVISAVEGIENGLTLRTVSSSSSRSFRTSSKEGNGREGLSRAIMWLYCSFRPSRTLSTSVRS